ncbi:MAG: AI-2E family transporter [Deltaproteobacteria bacterium]|nr:AI-2E family transporter [Deltaproteobacteria bacterium]
MTSKDPDSPSSSGREAAVVAELGPSPVPLAGPATFPSLEAPTPRRYGTVAFGVLFAFAGALFVVTVLPLVAEVLLGCLLAAFTFPLRDRVERWLPGRRIAPAVITFLLVLVVLVPIGLLGFTVVERLAHAVDRIPAQLASGDLDAIWRAYVPPIPGLSRLGGPRGLSSAIGTAASAIASSLPKILRGAFNVGIGFVLTLLTTYYLLRDGHSLSHRLVRALPLEPRHTLAILGEFRRVASAVVVGTLGTAFVQGLAAGLGYWVLGLDEPLLLATLTGIGCLIPMVGSGLVWVPAALWLVATGEVTRGIILALYGALIVSTIDNLVRPLLSRRGLSIHPLLVFLSLFGGLAAFGMAGLYLGPLFVALFVSVARIYEREIAPAATQGTEVVEVIPADTSLSYRLAQALSARLKRGKAADEKPGDTGRGSGDRD